MEHAHHFARTLRPRKLSDVIGQDFVVNMLQNSIYLGRFFPVYLFHGQRGCGKTTVARIIAAMINCSQFEAFRANPRATQLPCLECPSCVATAEGNHPDFIEIDAASHTGVDHVRTISESAHYLPLMGRKKIYLIDEAHMLSKAAFNALLKMLEEPPAQALFILATTEVAKIPVTVRSRAFQGIFNAPDHATVANYLTSVATNHGLTLQPEAAHLIVTKAERCVRDSLNLLEQLGAINRDISAETVAQALGMADITNLLAIMKAIIESNQEALFEALAAAHHDKNPTMFWNALSEAFQSLVRVHFKSPALGLFATHEADLKPLAAKATVQQLTAFNTLLWNGERIFNITASKSLFIEHFLTSLCSPQLLSVEAVAPQKQPAPKAAPASQSHTTFKPRAPQQPQDAAPRSFNRAPEAAVPEQSIPASSSWNTFLGELSTLPDKIPAGIFKKARPLFDGSTLTIEIQGLNSFLQEQLEDKSAVWKPVLKRCIPEATTFALKAALAQAPSTAEKRPSTEARQAPQLASRALAEGPTTDLIMKYFPGKLV